MSRAELDRLSRHHGITLSYDDPAGGRRPVPDETKRQILEALQVDIAGRPAGEAVPDRMVVPKGARCFLPDSLSASPGWGIFCQLYELRSNRNWGIGDFGDLAELGRICGAEGADFLGINPVHALFGANPLRRSPFSPSNRRFLNPLYIAVDLLPGFSGETPDNIADLQAATHVDYAGVSRVKLAALRALFADVPFGQGPWTRADHDAWIAEMGSPLRRHAIFETVSAIMEKRGHGEGWTTWPAEFQDPDGPEIRQVALEHDREVSFQLWLQWAARIQLGKAAAAANDAGMRIGLYLDLAVGEAPDGSSTWSGAAAQLPGLSIGAPPDMFATGGQNWGLAAPSPTALADAGFAPYREMIAAQLCDAGALRIDHAMALWQLFLIPEGRHPSQGAHLRYPMSALLEVLSQESRRHSAVIIGEDLGFVPEGFREAMEEAQILAYRILYFEQTEQGFKLPDQYPRTAMACLSTHDLPVLSQWWTAGDVALRRRHDLVDAKNSDNHQAHRRTERRDLVEVLRRSDCLDEVGLADSEILLDAILVAAHRFIARTPCLLAGVRLADMTGPDMPTNLPGTVDEYPNWSPRSPLPIEEIAAHKAFRAVTEAMRAERPRLPEVAR